MTSTSASIPQGAVSAPAQRKPLLRPPAQPRPADPVAAPSAKMVCTPRDVADMLGVSVKTLSDWRAKGFGPDVMRLSIRTLRYHIADVEAFIAGRRADNEATGAQG